jgi:hypothetical protein
MKVIVRNIALAIAVMGLTVACTCKGNDKTEVIDSVVDTTVVEEVVDTTPVEEVAEAVQTPAKPAKKAAAKTETKKEEQPANADPRASVKVEDGKAQVKIGNVKVESDNADPRAKSKAKGGKVNIKVN